MSYRQAEIEFPTQYQDKVNYILSLPTSYRKDKILGGLVIYHEKQFWEFIPSLKSFNLSELLQEEILRVALNTALIEQNSQKWPDTAIHILTKHFLEKLISDFNSMRFFKNFILNTKYCWQKIVNIQNNESFFPEGNCNLFSSNKFFIPTLEKIAMVYLHRSLGHQELRTLNSVITDYRMRSKVIYIMNNIWQGINVAQSSILHPVLKELEDLNQRCKYHHAKYVFSQTRGVLNPLQLIIKANSTLSRISLTNQSHALNQIHSENSINQLIRQSPMADKELNLKDEVILLHNYDPRWSFEQSLMTYTLKVFFSVWWYCKHKISGGNSIPRYSDMISTCISCIQ